MTKHLRVAINNCQVSRNNALDNNHSTTLHNSSLISPPQYSPSSEAVTAPCNQKSLFSLLLVDLTECKALQQMEAEKAWRSKARRGRRRKIRKCALLPAATTLHILNAKSTPSVELLLPFYRSCRSTEVVRNERCMMRS